MRTTFKVITSLLLAAMLLVSCVATDTSSVSITEATSGNTSVVVYDNGSEKLHVLNSNDALGDVSFIFEGEDELVGIELPAFTEGLEEWKSYVESLGKQMNNILHRRPCDR